jgi:hypothetical protein
MYWSLLELESRNLSCLSRINGVRPIDYDFAEFGSFGVRKRAARTAAIQKAREELKITASKVPAFKAGATFKGAVNRGSEVH